MVPTGNIWLYFWPYFPTNLFISFFLFIAFSCKCCSRPLAAVADNQIIVYDTSLCFRSAFFAAFNLKNGERGEKAGSKSRSSIVIPGFFRLISSRIWTMMPFCPFSIFSPLPTNCRHQKRQMTPLMRGYRPFFAIFQPGNGSIIRLFGTGAYFSLPFALLKVSSGK